MNHTELGKIKSVHIGLGGYQGVQFGVIYELGGKGWGVSDSENMVWSTERTADCKWTERDRESAHGRLISWRLLEEVL